MMGLAIVEFGWTGPQFMASTAHEYFAAYEVWWAMNKPAEQSGQK